MVQQKRKHNRAEILDRQTEPLNSCQKVKIEATTTDSWRIHVKEGLYRMDPPFSR